jgi:hypothetical protein
MLWRLIWVLLLLQFNGTSYISWGKNNSQEDRRELLAFLSGSQVAVAKGLKFTNITTARSTATYVHNFIDLGLSAKLTENRGRNRRVMFLLILVAGSFVGPVVGARTNFGVAVFVSAGVKTMICGLPLFNDGMDVKGDEGIGKLHCCFCNISCGVGNNEIADG